MNNKVQHNVGESRFEVIIDNLLSIVEYTIDVNGNLTVVHTEVPKELEGKGIAGVLTEALLKYAENNSLKVIPLCPYTKGYIKRHPEYEHLVAE